MRSARRGRRYFDLSTAVFLGLATLLLISMPGGCGEEDADAEDVETEEVAEPTSPPMMEIVDPEPGVIGSESDDAGESADSQDQGEQDAVVEEESDTAVGDNEYVVQAGDTVYGIAVRFGVTIDALLEVNGITDPNSLQVGQVLEIPSQD
jgi:nucleoid-associated protein YgaU